MGLETLSDIQQAQQVKCHMVPLMREPQNKNKLQSKREMAGNGESDSVVMGRGSVKGGQGRLVEEWK